MLTQAELLGSATVANATMNRGRGLSGVNSYQRELRHDIAAYLEARAREYGYAVWYDICCGDGRALVEAGQGFAASGLSVQIVGVDLVDTFAPAPPGNVRLVAADFGAFVLDMRADLLTCVHGLHYLGDKLGLLEQSYRQMAPGGLLLAHLDTANVRDADNPAPLWPRLMRRLRAAGVGVGFKSHILTLTRSEAALDFGVAYQGATVSAQPNYTGITVIDSWYTFQKD